MKKDEMEIVDYIKSLEVVSLDEMQEAFPNFSNLERCLNKLYSQNLLGVETYNDGRIDYYILTD